MEELFTEILVDFIKELLTKQGMVDWFINGIT
jgi:hypothetical protein